MHPYDCAAPTSFVVNVAIWYRRDGFSQSYRFNDGLRMRFGASPRVWTFVQDARPEKTNLKYCDIVAALRIIARVSFAMRHPTKSM